MPYPIKLFSINHLFLTGQNFLEDIFLIFKKVNIINKYHKIQLKYIIST